MTPRSQELAGVFLSITQSPVVLRILVKKIYVIFSDHKPNFVVVVSLDEEFLQSYIYVLETITFM